MKLIKIKCSDYPSFPNTASLVRAGGISSDQGEEERGFETSEGERMKLLKIRKADVPMPATKKLYAEIKSMYDRIQARLQKLGGDPNDLHRRDLVNKLGLVDKALAKPETTNPKNLELHARSLYSLSNGKLTLDPDHDVKWQQEFKTICSLAGSLLYKAADYVRAVRKGGLK